MIRLGGVVVTNTNSGADLVQLPATANRLPRFSSSGTGAKLSDSLYAQTADGHSIIAGIGASVNAGQLANTPAVVIGEGCAAWGDGAVAIGRNALAGTSAAKDAAIAIGYNVSTNGKNSIRIGSALAFGDDWIAIGTQCSAGGLGACGIAIGRSALAARTDTIAIGTTALTALNYCIAIGSNSNSSGTESICIGHGANCTGAANIAIGSSAQGSAVGGAGIAIGASAQANFPNSIAMGTAAVAPSAASIRFGDASNPMHSITVASLNMVGAGMNLFEHYRPFADPDGNVGLRLMTKKAGVIVLDQVTFGAVDSGGVGFRLLRVPN